MIKLNDKNSLAAFRSIVEKLGRDEVSAILLNWNDSELSDDGEKIFVYVGRDREYSRGATGGKSNVKKKDFIEWLLSEAPFDEAVYGKSIRADAEWLMQISAARVASGLYQSE